MHVLGKDIVKWSGTSRQKKGLFEVESNGAGYADCYTVGGQMRRRILGKEFIIFDPGISCDESDLARFLSKLSVTYLLRKIADTASQIDIQQGMCYVGEIPVDNYLLIFTAEYVIKYSNTTNYNEVTEQNFDSLLRMMYCIASNKLLSNNENRLTLLVTMSHQHFPSQENQLSELARSYYIYCSIWRKYNSDINVVSDIRDITGIHYPILLLFTYAYYGVKEGYFWPYEEEMLAKLARDTKLAFSMNSQSSYFDWSCCDLITARNYSGSLSIFQKYPLFKSTYRPLKTKKEVYFKISGRELHKKATIGIYYDLSEKYSNLSGKNIFRESFGQVFQEYVGIILREYFHSWNVQPEIKYVKNQSQRLSIDWIVWKDNKAILIEVKQNALGYKAKVSGSQEIIQKDIKRSIGKAMHQLETTKKEIESQNITEFSEFADIDQFETLIVLYDPLYYAREIVDHCLEESEFEEYSRHHIIGIPDFEYFCDCQEESESMFDILSYKRVDSRYIKLDFREYLIKMYPECIKQVGFHSRIYDEIFAIMSKISV